MSSRHPISPDWPEIARVLTDDGTYLAQHVGPESAFELSEWFLGPRCRMEFFDIGAVIYILRKCVWWVPDFTVDRYREALERLDAHIRERGGFLAHSTRTLVEARRAPR